MVEVTVSIRIRQYRDALTRKVVLGLLHGAGRVLGHFLWTCRSYRFYYSHTNINLSFPGLCARQVHRLAVRSMYETGKLLFETILFWVWPSGFYRRAIRRVHGEEHLRAAEASGRGVILINPHLGNWEVFNVYAGSFSACVLYKSLECRWLNRWVRYCRQKHGSRLVSTSEAAKALLLELNRGGVVSLMPDQVPDSSCGRLMVPFFGVPAWTGTLTSRLVAKTDAIVLRGFARRLPAGSGFEIHLQPVDDKVYSQDLETSVAAVNKEIEACIRQCPEQYTWEYKRFKQGIYESLYWKSRILS